MERSWKNRTSSQYFESRMESNRGARLLLRREASKYQLIYIYFLLVLAQWSPPSTKETVLWSRGPQEALNNTKLILNDYGSHSCSFRTNLVSLRTFRCPLFSKPVSWLGLFFAISYSKPALGYIRNIFLKSFTTPSCIKSRFNLKTDHLSKKES